MFALKAIQDWPEYLRRPILRCAAGELPPNVALMQMFATAADGDMLSAALVLASDAFEAAGRAGAAARLRAAYDLWSSAPEAIDTVRAVLAEADCSASGSSRSDTIGFWSDVFDRLSCAAPEAGVALYALGRSDVLDAATDEIVERMRGWGLLDRDGSLLDIGCGIGRFLTVLRGPVRQIVGLDISRGMLREAASRCGGARNVLLVQGSGRDLAPFADGVFDVVYAIDSLPYIVQAGADIVARCFAEAQRVLAPGGTFLIMNYSYRDSLERDQEDVGRLAADNRFTVMESGRGGFHYWDGSVFRLVKAGAAKERKPSRPLGCRRPLPPVRTACPRLAPAGRGGRRRWRRYRRSCRAGRPTRVGHCRERARVFALACDRCRSRSDRSRGRQ